MLKAVLTITTDLGETFYPDPTELIATIQSSDRDGDIYLRRRLGWKAGSRNVALSLDLTRQDIDWPAVVHISVKSTPTGFLPPIVDVCSAPLNPRKGHFNSGSLVTRRFTSTSSERDLVLFEETGDSIARHLWDGSQALAHHIDQTISLELPSATISLDPQLPLLEYVLISATYRKLTVLELGCGLGTVGISLAQSIPDCDVLLTDLPSVADLVNANITAMRPAIASRVSFAALDWEQRTLPKPIQARVHDLIVVSECTYNTSTLPALVSTLVLLLERSPKAIILVATKRRHESEAAFFDLMRDAGLIVDGETRVPLPGMPGTGYGDSAAEVGVFVFRGRLHRLSLSPRGSERLAATISKRPVRGEGWRTKTQ